MKRVWTTLRQNMLIQYRNGYYAVTALFILGIVLLLRLLPAGTRMDLLLPALVTLNLILSYFFIAALVLLERHERTLSAVFVTPLHASEYLVGKTLSLLVICTAENLLIILLSYGLPMQMTLLLAGMIALGGFYILIGFVVVARFRSLNSYLLPGGVVTPLFFLPLIDSFGLWHSPLMALHPVYPMLLLLRAAFVPATGGEVFFGMLGSLFWLAISFVWARLAFRRIVMDTSGF